MVRASIIIDEYARCQINFCIFPYSFLLDLNNDLSAMSINYVLLIYNRIIFVVHTSSLSMRIPELLDVFFYLVNLVSAPCPVATRNDQICAKLTAARTMCMRSCDGRYN